MDRTAGSADHPEPSQRGLAPFWARHPALFWGLHLIIGFGARGGWIILLGLLPLCLHNEWKKSLFGLLVAGAAYLYIGPQLTIPEEGIVGAGQLHIHQFVRPKSQFAKGWVVRGMMKEFQGAKQVPVTLFVRKGQERPKGDCDYWVEGKLLPGGRFEVAPDAPWWPVRRTFSGAEWRLGAQEKVKGYLERAFKNRRRAHLLGGLITGDFHDPALLFTFSRMGLQHLMAISGFHFSLVALIAALLFRFWTHQKVAAAILIGLMTGYLFFVGSGPSMQRAWVMSLCLFASWLANRVNTPVNGLGVALMVVSIWNPSSVFSLGFQFSFLCTAAILFFYSPCERGLRRVFSRFRLSEVKRMSLFDQHGVVVLALFRRIFALTLAVHFVAIPVTLFYFQRFPLMSFIYNLFFPFAISLAMICLPFVAVLSWAIPPLKGLLFAFEEGLVGISVDFAQAMPARLDIALHFPQVGNFWLVFYLIILFSWGAHLNQSSVNFLVERNVGRD